MRISSALPVAFLLLTACGSEPAEEIPAGDGVRDLRVAIPEPDAVHIDFIGADTVIAPGEEKMTCVHFRYDGEDTALSDVDTHQGKFGHHAILLGTNAPLPPGTVEDCTKPEDMAKYTVYTLGDADIPPGHGVFLPKGKAMVLQSHYLNTSATPIRVRDVLRLTQMPITDVKQWVASYATNSVAFSLPPHESSTITYDCTIEQDTNLMLIGGHMHEWGTRIEISVGLDETSMKSLYLVDPWQPEFRDAPPVTLMFENPMVIPKGTRLRTSCSWDNTSSKELGFPSEMCSAFAYLQGLKEPATCGVDQ
jgi:hypothetical protein